MNKKEKSKKITLGILSFIVIAILVVLFLLLFRPKKAETIAPIACTNLVYNGKNQKLINPGTTDGGEWLYRLEGEEYSHVVPKATNAGTYKVYYKLDGNNKYEDIEEAFFKVTIAKAHASIKVDETPIVKTYGETVILPRATSNYGTVTCDKKSSDLVNAGTYTLKYMVETSDNYVGDIKTVSVKINKLGVNEPTFNSLYVYTGEEQTVSFNGVMSYMSTTDSLKGTNVGEYTVRYKLDSNHQWNEGSDGIVNWTIKKGNALITVNQNPITNTFGETVSIPQATSNFGNVACDKTSSDLVNVGTYTITYKINDSENYYGDTKTVSVTINKLGVDEPTVNGTYTYTGSPLTVSLNGVMAYMTTNSSLVGTDANTYYVIYKLDNNHCWNEGSDGVVTWNIAKASPVISVDETPIVKTYGQTISIPQATSNFGEVTCDTVSSNLINAGTYTITYKVAGTDNYNETIKTVSVTIEKLGVNEPTVSGTYSYTGKSQKVSLNGVKSYMYTTDSLNGTNVDTYTINYMLDNNHKWNDGSDGVVTWSIEKGNAVITVNQTAIVKTYGDSITIPKATTNYGTVSCDKVKTDLVNAGTYTITYTVEGTSNYNGDTKTVSVTINQKGVNEPTVTGTYTYTGSPLTVSLSGVQSYMTTTDSLTGTNVDTYTISYTITNNNYKWNTGSDGIVTWTINKANASITVDQTAIVKTYGETVTIPTATTIFGTVTCDKVATDLVNAGTYTITYSVEGTANFNGDTKTVSVTINQLGVDEPAVTGSYTYTGNSQTVSLSGVESYMSTNDVLVGTDVNTYTITYTITDNNYKWNTGSDGIVTWTINKANASITVDQTAIIKIYGETVTIPTATTNFGTVTCDKVATDLVNAGSYTITYTVEGTSNYNGDTKTVSVTINQLGVDEPTVTGTYTYKGAQQKVSLKGVKTYMTTSDSLYGNNVGTYTITYTITDNNYKWNADSDGVVTWSIAKANATIYVNQKAIIKTYGETVTIPTATTNFGTVTCDKVATDLVNVGTYTITYTVEGTANYNGDSKTVSVTINQLGVDEPTVSGSYTYTGSAQTVTLNGVESYMSTTDSLSQTNAGEYTINYSLDGNHKWNTGSDGKVSWNIAKANAKITLGNESLEIEYNPEYSYNLPSATSTFGTVTCDTVSSQITELGEYTLTYTVEGTANYNGDTTSTKITIGKGNPIISIAGRNIGKETVGDELVSFSVRQGVKIYFAVTLNDTEQPDDSAYSEEVPTSSTDGNYYVWYKVPETTYYYEVEPAFVKAYRLRCIAKGTKITMADGSLKKIEDIQEGEEVLTFNHEKGIYEAKSAYYIFKGEDTQCAFTLNFEDGNKISIIGDHAFFELESLQYVVIYEYNATEFIGKHYYNATTNKYTKLVSVTFETTPVEYYELYTTNFNCIAENMLNAPADNVAFVNYYKFNADLTIDKEQLEKDIATYGLYAYSEDAPYTKEEFDEYNWKYAYIVVGKGLMTYDELIAFRDDYYSNLE